MSGTTNYDPGRNMVRQNPLHDDDLAEFNKLQKTVSVSANSWSVDASIFSSVTSIFR